VKSFISEISKVIGSDRILTRELDLLVYGYDSTPFVGKPSCVVLPETVEEVSLIVIAAAKYNLQIITRGAGTSLSGGPIPCDGSIVLAFSRMDKVLEIDTENGWAVVEPGVTNQSLQNELLALGYWFPPDPASLSVATIGGNVAENAGGPHCLKYGVTSNHVMNMEVVLADGQIIHTGSSLADYSGYNLTGLLIGSEGTMGIVTKIQVKISKLPESTATILAIYESCWDAATSVFEIIRNGFTPSVLEMIEETMLREVNEVFELGYPETAKSLLIIEVDGEKEGLPYEIEGITDICRNNSVKVLQVAETEQERDKLWRARRGGTSALGRLKPDSAENDIVVPRSKLPHMVDKIKEISERNGVIMGAVIHAGDGNCHPQVPFDGRIQKEKEAAERALWEVFEAAVDLGGTISGEHGIGLEKIDGMKLVFSKEEMILMRKLKLLFDPNCIFNPDKMFPKDIIAAAQGG
jgi:glycolate oxidase